MTVTSTNTPEVARPNRFQADESTAGLTLLLGELDKVGLSDQMQEARGLLARAGQLLADANAQARQANDARRALVADVAAGRVALADVGARLAAGAGWSAERGAAPFRVVVDRAVEQLRGDAVRTLHADGFEVHDALEKLVKVAVRRSVDAGRKLVNVPAVVKALTPPKRHQDRFGQYSGEHPWVLSPPVLPVVDGASLAADLRTATVWAEASEAARSVSTLWEVAATLDRVGGPGSDRFAGDINRDVQGFVAKFPDQVQLALADALGWKPGLHLRMGPAPRQPIVAAPFWSVPPVPKIGPFGWPRG